MIDVFEDVEMDLGQRVFPHLSVHSGTNNEGGSPGTHGSHNTREKIIA